MFWGCMMIMCDNVFGKDFLENCICFEKGFPWFCGPKDRSSWLRVSCLRWGQWYSRTRWKRRFPSVSVLVGATENATPCILRNMMIKWDLLARTVALPHKVVHRSNAVERNWSLRQLFVARSVTYGQGGMIGFVRCVWFFWNGFKRGIECMKCFM